MLWRGRPVRGLSPRVRGNRCQRLADWSLHRSIPARAGEPWRQCRSESTGTVYPRACGGTHHEHGCPTGQLGLSPRVRGNPWRAPWPPSNPGSIPARAGEPQASPLLYEFETVYPRACGGTQRPTEPLRNGPGLSPRVRGNLFHYGTSVFSPRSIPARAGEPHRAVRRSAVISVYPRACGGTTLSVANPLSVMGLSPRVRGNRRATSRLTSWSGSIPARAGEPAGAAW